MADVEQRSHHGGRLTTFIDFRYSRALAAALFAGQEKEESAIVFDASVDNYIAVAIDRDAPERIAELRSDNGDVVLSLVVDHLGNVCISSGREVVVAAGIPDNRIVGIRVGSRTLGLKCGDKIVEANGEYLQQSVTLITLDGVKVMGQGTGRAARWGELFYRRGKPTGLCVQLVMDWHHLRAGIPLFGTMTAEHLIEEGKYRLRFKSYAYDSSDALDTDFVRLFDSGDDADIAVHLTPALYDSSVSDIPNLAFAVIESTSVHPHLVERCNRMDEILVPTTFTARVFRDSGVTRPIHVISHGVDTDFFRPAPAPRTLPGGRRFNFLAVATHVERKNIRHLVRAFLEEFREEEEVALFLLLRPEYHTSQNNVALEFTDWEREWGNGSAPIFLWTGYLTREHLRDFYANANAYVMPSNEGFGLTVIEAMACETPVIALDHGGVTDFVSASNAALVKKGRQFVAQDVDTLPYVGDRFFEPDLSDLRRAMRDIVENESAAREKARRARIECETNLTWAKVSADFSRCIEDTYQRCRSAKKQEASAPVQSTDLLLILCVMDDEDAARSIDYLRTLIRPGVRALCLFTRYARIGDVMRARKHGFAYYRWNGTLDNALTIARSIVGQSSAAVLNTGEVLSASTPRYSTSG